MADITIKGRLRGGIVGVGGEHTGYNLENVTIEIDVSMIENAQALDDKEIIAEGNFELKHYVERGDVWVFIAKSVTEHK